MHAIVETHGALRQVWDIAALPWMQSLAFGLMDFVSDHHGALGAAVMRSPGQFEHQLIVRAKAEIVAAALANGIVPAHNVTLELKDTAVVHDDARRARREFGFLRMWSIYPAQIQPIVDAMKPDHSEVENGAAILLAAQKTTGARSSMLANCTTARLTATTGTCCKKPGSPASRFGRRQTGHFSASAVPCVAPATMGGPDKALAFDLR